MKAQGPVKSAANVYTSKGNEGFAPAAGALAGWLAGCQPEAFCRMQDSGCRTCSLQDQILDTHAGSEHCSSQPGGPSRSQRTCMIVSWYALISSRPSKWTFLADAKSFKGTVLSFSALGSSSPSSLPTHSGLLRLLLSFSSSYSRSWSFAFCSLFSPSCRLPLPKVMSTWTSLSQGPFMS